MSQKNSKLLLSTIFRLRILLGDHYYALDDYDTDHRCNETGLKLILPRYLFSLIESVYFPLARCHAGNADEADFRIVARCWNWPGEYSYIERRVMLIPRIVNYLPQIYANRRHDVAREFSTTESSPD